MADAACFTFGAPLSGGRALLVTAHPDDEAMFFAPAVLCLARSVEVHILCLSSGDYDGLGAVRARELPHACACLGVPPARVRVLDDPQLRDGPCTHWPAAHEDRIYLSIPSFASGIFGVGKRFDSANG